MTVPASPDGRSMARWRAIERRGPPDACPECGETFLHGMIAIVKGAQLSREAPFIGSAPALYGFAVFLSSAVTLVLEITAGRLIAPYVGVSIYSWSSIIGVMLAGLSLGNWLGGARADRGGTDRSAGLALVAAALASLGVLLALTLAAPVVVTAELSPMSGAFVLSLSLFFVPAALLGVITPLLTTLALRRSKRPGRVVGSMHALAALGSIAGTFFAGFWLIQHLGTRHILVLCAITLLVLAAPFLLRRAAGALAWGWRASCLSDGSPMPGTAS